MVSLQQFQSFLISEQNDQLGNDDRNVSTFICDFLGVNKQFFFVNSRLIEYILGSIQGDSRALFYCS